MRLSVAVAALIALSSGCGRMPDKSEIKYDSYHSIALDGAIDNGVIITSSSYDSTIRDQILTQLRYSVGFLNGYQSVGDISKTLTKSIVIKNKEQLPSGDWKVIFSTDPGQAMSIDSANKEKPKSLNIDSRFTVIQKRWNHLKRKPSRENKAQGINRKTGE